MLTVYPLESNFAYLRQLVGAGLEGIASAQRETSGGVFTPALNRVIWGPAAIGAAAGVLSSGLIGNRKSGLRLVMGGLLGTALGSGAALGWASRRFVGPAARRAAHHVNAARDTHWLATHPIDYA
jgi:hypothetical protein